MAAKKKTGYEVQAEVFMAELTRRLANDCVSAFGRFLSVRSDVGFRVRPIKGPREEAWAEIQVAMQPHGSQTCVRSFAYVVPGEPSAVIDEKIQEAIEKCEAEPTPDVLAERRRLERLERLDELKVALNETDRLQYPERYRSLQAEYRRVLQQPPE